MIPDAFLGVVHDDAAWPVRTQDIRTIPFPGFFRVLLCFINCVPYCPHEYDMADDTRRVLVLASISRPFAFALRHAPFLIERVPVADFVKPA